MKATRGVWGLVLAITVTAAAAQPSSGVIRVVVPFAAGGVQDIVARSFNAELGAALGRTVIVENRPGAGGTIGNAAGLTVPWWGTAQGKRADWARTRATPGWGMKAGVAAGRRPTMVVGTAAARSDSGG